MPEFDDITELFTAVIVIFIISVIIALAWLSTYVQEQPILATAVVVFHQDSSPASSLETTSNQVSERVTTNNSALNNPMSNSEPTHNSSSVENKDNHNSSVKNNDNEKKQACNDKIHLQKTENTHESTSNINPGSDAEGSTSNLCPGSETTKEREDVKNVSILRERKTSIDISTTENENPESSEVGTHCEDLTQEYIRIKLKFLDDTHRLVRGQLTDEVGSFKRANFSLELSSNQVVRLIFNGQLLNRENSTLGQYGLFDNCVVHCHISQQQISNNNELRNNSISNTENDGLDLSEMLSPILVVIIAFLWYLRFSYSHIFNTSSTIVLVCLTALLLISQYALTFSVNISFGLREGNGNNNNSGNSNIVTRSGVTGDNGRNTMQPEVPNIEEQVPLSSAPSSSQSTSATSSCKDSCSVSTFKNNNSNSLKNSSTDGVCQTTNDVGLNSVSDTSCSMTTTTVTTTNLSNNNNSSATILSA
ncbi:Transmembrane and ubiquitin-like domain-containing protein 1 [Armadillidium nasatum]|uniref:Transmembrane and ubiquitin-like domain-containing protein 1 n=1 Tax=Armadillidium nasatum TaxID=96803 RepID=A0A5N5T8R8_9CRUS|nr:Transmembrane and ubiquitin-like domain-containing protein 1 [Armadillidium nasatum]